MNPVIQIRDLEVKKAAARICFVPELEIQAGEHLAVTGPNGSGKTTLLRVLAGLQRCDAGQCRIAVHAAKRVYVHQQPYLFRGTVGFNVAYGLGPPRMPRKQRTSLSLHWLEVFGVEHLADRQSENLSGGERRRIALARAFALGRDLVLLDEPYAELDDEGIACVSRALANCPATIVIATPHALPEAFPARTYGLTKTT